MKTNYALFDFKNQQQISHAGIGGVNRNQIDETDINSRNLHELADSFRDDIFKLTKLSYGWDGYDGIPVKTEIADFAIRIINEIVCFDMSRPSVVPGSDGTLQLEWHKNGYSVEIDIMEPYAVTAERIDLVSNENIEIELTDDFSILSNWLKDLVIDRKLEQ